MSAVILSGDHPRHGRLFAAWDSETRCTTPAVAHSRFSAFLTPFNTESAAIEAMAAAGAEIEPVAGRVKRKVK